MVSGTPVEGACDAIASTTRVEAVAATGLLDTEPEEAFDRLTRLASALLDAPMVFVTLVDERRSYWKSTTGFDAGPPEQRQNHVEESFCQFVVSAGAEQVIPDTRADHRTRGMAAVDALDIGAWVGLPIRSADGEVLGTFCAMDTRRRDWSEQDLEVLRTLAQAAGGEIALRVALRQTQLAYAEAARHAANAEHHAAEAERNARRAEQSAAEATELAETLQQSLLPADAPRIPGMEVAARYRPGGRGAEVLGDFYDVFPVTGGWGVVIGDVCGKGAWAARTTALARSTVRAVGHTEDSPEAVLTALNEVLHVWFSERRSFVTATYATITAREGAGLDVVVVTGGHPPSFVLRADGEVVRLQEGGRALGIRPDARVAREETALFPGDSLVFYTDGITESRVVGGEQFGEDGVARALAELPPGPGAETVADAIASAALEHAGGAVLDDTAVIVVRSPAG
ncbi:PP2C family protein-serine/threonine phosphatase [Actinomycetospora chiangmaiensis]|uniref:PP2C family protein-serine/threonine phosphatase n=1 Tax=Actinomycetospora chiangmaiensis TaxID=402650 RepID=UPI0003634CF7|nr:GAF domain-containing SpoIIE family protein phosphatase [Actinomycetospora chiangmaiensis]